LDSVIYCACYSIFLGAVFFLDMVYIDADLCSRQFYGISCDFPSDQLMVRCEKGKKRNVYFVSSVIKQLVQTNAEKFKVSRSVSLSLVCCSFAHIIVNFACVCVTDVC